MNKILTYFLTSRVLFFIFAFLAINFIPLKAGYLGNQFDSSVPYLAWIWANLDGVHFLNIATFGYRNFDFAFFPFYPLLISFVNKFLLIPTIYAGILISVVSFILSLIVIYKIVRLDYQEKIAKLTVILLSFFPLSFFYQAVYSDSLFLLLSTTSFYLARRGNWFLSGLFGGLTTLTRIAGIALIPALAVEWYLQHSRSVIQWRTFVANFLKAFFSRASIKLITVTALTALGFIFYLIYLQIYHGDFLIFQKSMVAWRQHEFVLPPQVIFRYLNIFLLVNKNLLVFWVALLEFISMILYFALTFYVIKKVRLSYGILMFFVFLLPTFTGTFAGMPRYILHAFPAFLGIALLINKRKSLKVGLLVLFLILGLVFTGLFTRGYFFA